MFPDERDVAGLGCQMNESVFGNVGVVTDQITGTKVSSRRRRRLLTSLPRYVRPRTALGVIVVVSPFMTRVFFS
jgi:hypothetical protein